MKIKISFLVAGTNDAEPERADASVGPDKALPEHCTQELSEGPGVGTRL